MIGVFIPWLPEIRAKRSDHEWVGWVIDGNGCHIWTGYIDPKGYGQVSWRGSTQMAAKARYLLEIGPIPEGMHLDHYACNGGPNGCCNPVHCRPVTPRENIYRGTSFISDNLTKTHCPCGHPLLGDNLVQSKLLKRGCRVCRTCHNKQHRDRKRAAKNKLI